MNQAEHEMTSYLRDRISQRERAQHQVAILSGGTIAAAASVMSQSQVSPWLILGLSILMLAFALAMLNNDFHIAASATFLVEQKTEDGVIQRAWEIHLQREVGRWGHGSSWLRANLRLVTPYALPVLGTLGAIGVFMVTASGWQRLAVLIPVGFGFLFVLSALDIRRRYWNVFERASTLAEEEAHSV